MGICIVACKCNVKYFFMHSLVQVFISSRYLLICTDVLISGVLIMLTLQHKATVCQPLYSRESQMLREVPTYIPADVVEVNIRSNRITEIEDNVFYKLRYCKVLIISYNWITEIRRESFNGLNNL